jgi:hypothetical protein
MADRISNITSLYVCPRGVPETGVLFISPSAIDATIPSWDALGGSPTQESCVDIRFFFPYPQRFGTDMETNPFNGLLWKKLHSRLSSWLDSDSANSVVRLA